MELKVFGIGLCWCFIGWKYTSESKTILLWTDTGILCHLMGLLYYLLYKKRGDHGIARLHPRHKVI